MNLSISRLVVPRVASIGENGERSPTHFGSEPRRIRAATLTLDTLESGRGVSQTAGDTESATKPTWDDEDFDGDELDGYDSEFLQDDDVSVVKSVIKAIPGAIKATLTSPRETSQEILHQGLVKWKTNHRRQQRRTQSPARVAIFSSDNERWVVLRQCFGAVWFERVPKLNHELFNRGTVRVDDKLQSPLVGSFSPDGTMFAFAMGDEVMFMWEGSAMGTELKISEFPSPVKPGLDPRSAPDYSRRSRRIVGIGFTPKHQDAVCVTSSGLVYLAKSSANYSVVHPLVELPGLNDSEREEKGVNCAAICKERLFVASAQRFHVYIVDESSGNGSKGAECKVRLIPFQHINIFSMSAPLAATGISSRVKNLTRRFVGMRTWSELTEVKQMKINLDGSKVALMNARRNLVVVDVSESIRVIGEKVYEDCRSAIPLCFIRSSSSPSGEKAEVDEDRLIIAFTATGKIMVVPLGDLDHDLLDEHNESSPQSDWMRLPIADMCSSTLTEASFVLRSSSEIVLDVEDDFRIGQLRPCSAEEMLQQLIDQKDFDGAFAFCERRKLSRDPVHKRLFETMPVTKQTLEDHLYKISHRKWILNVCAHRIPAESIALNLELLNFARRLCGKDEPDQIQRFDLLLERTEAFKVCYSSSDKSFDPSLYGAFRDESTSAFDQAKRLALCGKVEELKRFCFDTVWGSRDLPPPRYLELISFIAETSSPLEYKDLFTRSFSESPPSLWTPSWFIRRALDVEKRTGSLRNAMDTVEIGIELFASNNEQQQQLKQVKREIEQLKRLIYECGVDFSLGLEAWMNEMTPLDKLRMCFSDRQTFWSRVSGLYDDKAPPIEAQKWLKAFKDLIIDEVLMNSGGSSSWLSLSEFKSLVLDSPSKYLFRNRMDGRRMVLELSVEVLQHFVFCRNRDEGKSLVDGDAVFARLEELKVESEVEMAFAKKSSQLRAELETLYKRFGVLKTVLSRVPPSTMLTLSQLKQTQQARDDSLVFRMLEGLKRLGENELDQVKASVRDALSVAESLGVPLRAIRTKAVKELLLAERFDAAAELFVEWRGSMTKETRDGEERVMHEVLKEISRELFVQDRLDACRKVFSFLTGNEPPLELRGLVEFVTTLRNDPFKVQGLVPLELLLVFDRSHVDVFRKVLEDHAELLLSSSSSLRIASEEEDDDASRLGGRVEGELRKQQINKHRHKKRNWIQGLAAMAVGADDEEEEEENHHRKKDSNTHTKATGQPSVSLLNRLVSLGATLGLTPQQVIDEIIPNVVLQQLLLPNHYRLDEAKALVDEILHQSRTEAGWKAAKLLSEALKSSGRDERDVKPYLAEAILRVESPDSLLNLVEELETKVEWNPIIEMDEWKKLQGYRSVCAASLMSIEGFPDQIALNDCETEAELMAVVYARVLKEHLAVETAATVLDQLSSNRRLLLDLIEGDFPSRKDAEVFVKALRKKARSDAIQHEKDAGGDEDIDEDLYLSDASYRFKTVQTRLSVPSFALGTNLLFCRDLDVDLHPQVVIRLFTCLNTREVTVLKRDDDDDSGLSDVDWRQGFAYAIRLFTYGKDWFDQGEIEFRLQVLGGLARDCLGCIGLADRIDKKRLKIGEFISKCGTMMMNHNTQVLKRIGVGSPVLVSIESLEDEESFSFQSSVLKQDVLQQSAELCSSSKTDPQVFAKLVSEVSDVKLRPSEVLMHFLLFVLLGRTQQQSNITPAVDDDEERRFLYMASRKAYETRCRPLLRRLVPKDLLVFTCRVAFAVGEMDLETRSGCVRDCIASIESAKVKPGEDAALKKRMKGRMEYLSELLRLDLEGLVPSPQEYRVGCRQIALYLEQEEHEVSDDELNECFGSFVTEELKEFTSFEIIETIGMHRQSLVVTKWIAEGIVALKDTDVLQIHLPPEVTTVLESRATAMANPENRTRLVKTMVRFGLASEFQLKVVESNERLLKAKSIALKAKLSNDPGDGWRWLCSSLKEDWDGEKIEATLNIVWLFAEEEDSNEDDWQELVGRLILLIPDSTLALKWFTQVASVVRPSINKRIAEGFFQSSVLVSKAFEVALNPQLIPLDVESIHRHLAFASFVDVVGESSWLVRLRMESHEEDVMFPLNEYLEHIGWTRELVKTIPLKVLSRIVLDLNDSDFNLSVSRLIVASLIKWRDVQTSFELAVEHRRFPSLVLLRSRPDKSEFLKLFLTQTMTGIERESSRLRFVSDDARIVALKQFFEATTIVDELVALQLKDDDEEEDAKKRREKEERKLSSAAVVKETKVTRTPLKQPQGEWAWDENDDESPFKEKVVEVVKEVKAPQGEWAWGDDDDQDSTRETSMLKATAIGKRQKPTTMKKQQVRQKPKQRVETSKVSAVSSSSAIDLLSSVGAVASATTAAKDSMTSNKSWGGEDDYVDDLGTKDGNVLSSSWDKELLFSTGPSDSSDRPLQKKKEKENVSVTPQSTPPSIGDDVLDLLTTRSPPSTLGDDPMTTQPPPVTIGDDHMPTELPPATIGDEAVDLLTTQETSSSSFTSATIVHGAPADASKSPFPIPTESSPSSDAVEGGSAIILKPKQSNQRRSRARESSTIGKGVSAAEELLLGGGGVIPSTAAGTRKESSPKEETLKEDQKESLKEETPKAKEMTTGKSGKEEKRGRRKDTKQQSLQAAATTDVVSDESAALLLMGASVVVGPETSSSSGAAAIVAAVEKESKEFNRRAHASSWDDELDFGGDEELVSPRVGEAGDAIGGVEDELIVTTGDVAVAGAVDVEGEGTTTGDDAGVVIEGEGIATAGEDLEEGFGDQALRMAGDELGNRGVVETISDIDDVVVGSTITPVDAEAVRSIAEDDDVVREGSLESVNRYGAPDIPKEVIDDREPLSDVAKEVVGDLEHLLSVAVATAVDEDVAVLSALVSPVARDDVVQEEDEDSHRLEKKENADKSPTGEIQVGDASPVQELLVEPSGEDSVAMQLLLMEGSFPEEEELQEHNNQAEEHHQQPFKETIADVDSDDSRVVPPRKTFSEEFPSAATQLYKLESSRLVAGWIEPAAPSVGTEEVLVSVAESDSNNKGEAEAVVREEQHQRRLSESEWFVGKEILQSHLFPSSTAAAADAGEGEVASPIHQEESKHEQENQVDLSEQDLVELETEKKQSSSGQSVEKGELEVETERRSSMGDANVERPSSDHQRERDDVEVPPVVDIGLAVEESIGRPSSNDRMEREHLVVPPEVDVPLESIESIGSASLDHQVELEVPAVVGLAMDESKDDVVVERDEVASESEMVVVSNGAIDDQMIKSPRTKSIDSGDVGVVVALEGQVTIEEELEVETEEMQSSLELKSNDESEKRTLTNAIEESLNTKKTEDDVNSSIELDENWESTMTETSFNAAVEVPSLSSVNTTPLMGKSKRKPPTPTVAADADPLALLLSSSSSSPTGAAPSTPHSATTSTTKRPATVKSSSSFPRRSSALSATGSIDGGGDDRLVGERATLTLSTSETLPSATETHKVAEEVKTPIAVRSKPRNRAAPLTPVDVAAADPLSLLMGSTTSTASSVPSSATKPKRVTAKLSMTSTASTTKEDFLDMLLSAPVAAAPAPAAPVSTTMAAVAEQSEALSALLGSSTTTHGESNSPRPSTKPGKRGGGLGAKRLVE